MRKESLILNHMGIPSIQVGREPLLVPTGASEPYPKQRRDRDQRKKPVHAHENGRMDTRRIRDRRRRARIELAPHRGDEAERAEQDQHAAVRDDHPFRHNAGKAGLGAETAGEREKTGTNPGAVSALGREDGAIGRELRAPVGAILDAFCAAFQLVRAIGKLPSASLERLLRHGAPIKR